MKRICLCLLLALCCVFSGVCAGEENPSSAAERIMFYHQDTSDAALAAYPYNAIHCKSASYTVLGGNGCSLFAGLHAYQWLFGRYESLEEQTAHAQAMVNLLQGSNPAVQGNGSSAALAYARQQGALMAGDLRTEQRIVEFFDQNRGVLYINAIWPGGGHFFVAVGYTRHEINGRETLLLHIVDSSYAATVTNFEAYDFESFARAEVQENGGTAQEYWMPLQQGVNVLYGLWTRDGAEKP